MVMTGACACGALRFRAEGEPLVQGLCHCRDCQRLTGSGHVGFIGFPEGAVSVEGETRNYSHTGSSGQTATRYACVKCGSMIFGRADVMPGIVNLYAGALDDTAQFRPRIAIFTRSRPAWDSSSTGLQCFDTLPDRN
jgi:hypothetical protein